MITLTRLDRDHSRFAVNADLISRVQASPDTTVVLIDGSTFIVRETLDEVIDVVAKSRANVLALASGYIREREGL